MIIDEHVGSLEEQVYSKLEKEILLGNLEKGKIVTECELANMLGVSRTPVRGALRRLNEEGLIEIEPNKRITVIGISIDDLIDTYKIRCRLEGLSSALAAEKMTDEELKKLTDFVELSEYYLKKEDTDNLRELDTQFHSIIYKASGNRILCRILSELHRNITRYRKISLAVPGRLPSSVSEHREILNAIIERDAKKADELTSRHVERALINLKNAVKDDKNGLHNS